jgi:hypothetical protein
MVATSVKAVTALMPGRVSSRRICGAPSTLAGNLAVQDGQLAIQEVDLAQAAVDHGLLIGGRRLSCLAGQPRSPAGAEQVAYWWVADQVADQH